jgi:hypothetical protein
MFPQKLATRLRDRLVQSRFLTISLTLHAVLLLVLATVVVVKPLVPPEPEFTSDGSLVVGSDPIAEPPPEFTSVSPKTEDFTPPAGAAQTDFAKIISVDSRDKALIFVPPSPGSPGVPREGMAITDVPGLTKGNVTTPHGLTPGQLKDIGRFTDHRAGSRSSNGGWEFTAYIGRYNGNWHSTVRLHDGQIAAGSLPNLLYVTSQWTKERIKTNERNVQAIPLDSDEIFTTRPPFIFLTGTRDFTLTEKEVENLQKYIRLGGAIWGDSSVPGERSGFDIAFEREMKRVLGENTAFEALPENHPVLTKGYFPKVKTLPGGINHYREPVRVMRWGGEIAVIQTRNDYGDMWQIGLDKDGKIDLSRNKHGQYVAMNDNLWSNRGAYVRNIEQPAVEQAYKFGINMIFHLITRWEARTANWAPL